MAQATAPILDSTSADMAAKPRMSVFGGKAGV
ncbi:MAG: hypothetical protein K0R61_5223, partial [Microvirga sp.]|nr:hypothetical protein [Microvirga sp.]